MVLRGSVLLAFLAVLCGCAMPSGVAVDRITDARLAGAYIPLRRAVHLGIDHDAGAAMVIQPGIAVTNAHNANLIDPKLVIGKSAKYDLLFFHTDRNTVLETSAPRQSEVVLAYGQNAYGPSTRLAHGVVRLMESSPLCTICGPLTAFGFEGDAGEGFSGGPVLDAADGRLIGIVFSYDPAKKGHQPMIYAYTMARVRAELAQITGHLPLDVD